MRTRERRILENCWFMYTDWRDKKRGNQNEAETARDKAVSLLPKYHKGCEHVHGFDAQNISCKKCKRLEPIAFKICSEWHNEVLKAAKKAKAEKKKRVTTRPWAMVIDLLAENKARKEIIKAVVGQFKSETSCKSFVASCGCAYNALNGKTRKKDGVVFLYAEWLKNGMQGAEPTGDSSSKSYVRNVYEHIKKQQNTNT